MNEDAAIKFNQRVKSLEAEVATLQAEVKELKKIVKRHSQLITLYNKILGLNISWTKKKQKKKWL